jgi:hypothetical protein
MWGGVAFERTDVLEEGIISVIKVTRIDELGTLAVTTTEARYEEIICSSKNHTAYHPR